MSSTIARVRTKTFSPRRVTPQQRQDTDGEGNVRRHGNAPPSSRFPGTNQGPEENGRNHHASDGGDDGKGGGARLLQLAAHQLALDLQPHDEEEKGHQRVVDPVLQRLLQRPPCRADANLVVPEVVVSVLPWTVGPDEGDHGGREQDDPAAAFGLEELEQRPACVGQARLTCSYAGDDRARAESLRESTTADQSSRLTPQAS